MVDELQRLRAFKTRVSTWLQNGPKVELSHSGDGMEAKLDVPDDIIQEVNDDGQGPSRDTSRNGH